LLQSNKQEVRENCNAIKRIKFWLHAEFSARRANPWSSQAKPCHCRKNFVIR